MSASKKEPEGTEGSGSEPNWLLWMLQDFRLCSASSRTNCGRNTSLSRILGRVSNPAFHSFPKGFQIVFGLVGACLAVQVDFLLPRHCLCVFRPFRIGLRPFFELRQEPVQPVETDLFPVFFADRLFHGFAHGVEVSFRRTDYRHVQESRRKPVLNVPQLVPH